jgi:hypothetical protein
MPPFLPGSHELCLALLSATWHRQAYFKGETAGPEHAGSP